MAPDRNSPPRREPAPARRGPGHRLHLALPRGAQVLATAFLALAAVLVPWTVFLGLSLPPKYDAGHRNILWTGFDVALIVVLGYAAWATWFHRQILATTAIVAGILLLCDAWFDIVTSIGRPDQWVTLLTGSAWNSRWRCSSSGSTGGLSSAPWPRCTLSPARNRPLAVFGRHTWCVCRFG